MTNTPSEYPASTDGGAEATVNDPYAESMTSGSPAEVSPPTWVVADPRAEADPSGEASTTDVAKDEAAQVKDTAVDAGKDVADTAKQEAGKVAEETKQQAKSLLGSARDEVQSQAGTQQQKLAGTVHSWSKELGGMASGSSESGPLTDLAHQAATKSGEIAHWLENSEPRDVLREVTSFARRRPVLFLALCGAAGVVAGRLTRGAVAANTSVDSPKDGSGTDSGAGHDVEPRSLSSSVDTSGPVPAPTGDTIYADAVYADTTLDETAYQGAGYTGVERGVDREERPGGPR